MSLRRLTLNTASMSSVTMLRMLAQIMVIPILARFLSPEDYGIVAMAMPFVLFAMMFSDAGVGMSLVRTAASEHCIWSTCFWFVSFLGLILTLIIIGIAPLLATFLSAPRLEPVVMALALVVLLQAVTTVPGAALQQNHRFGVIASIEIVSMFLSISSAIITAIQGWGAWALVVQQLVHYVVRLVLTLCLSSFRPRLFFKLQEIKEHLIFGRDVLGVNVVNFLTNSADNLAIGRVQGVASTGIYSMSFLFAILPSRIVSGPLRLVSYPHLSQIRDDKESVQNIFLFLTRILAILVISGMAMIAVAHEPIFRILLSEKWAYAGYIFMLIAPGAALQTITALCGTVLLVYGRTDIRLRQAIEFGVLRLVALFCVVWFGLEWVAIIYSLVVFLYFPRLVLLVLPHIGCRVFDYLRVFFVPLVVTAFCVGAYLEIKHLIHPEDWVQIVLAFGLILIGILVSAIIQGRTILSEVARMKMGK